jgi:hypothetical protein
MAADQAKPPQRFGLWLLIILLYNLWWIVIVGAAAVAVGVALARWIGPWPAFALMVPTLGAIGGFYIRSYERAVDEEQMVSALPPAALFDLMLARAQGITSISGWTYGVVSVVRDRQLVIQMQPHGWPVIYTRAWLFVPDEAGTTVRLRSQVQLLGWWRVFTPWMGPQLRRQGRASLAAFARLIEPA